MCMLCEYWAIQWSWFAQVNALCNLSHKTSQEVSASLPGWFLSRLCFTLCITMEVEPRIAKQYKCHHCCSCKNYWGKGLESGKKVFCFCFLFLADQKIVSSRGKCILGLPIGQFGEAGLLEWMPFVIFHTRSHERSQHHFQADFWVDIALCCV